MRIAEGSPASDTDGHLHRTARTAPGWPAIVVAAAIVWAAPAGGEIRRIIRTGEALPGYGSTITGLRHPVLNDAGQVAFGAYDNGYYSTEGAYRADSNGITTLTTSYSLLSASSGHLAINNAGEITGGVTLSIFSGDGAVYLMDGNSIQTIAQEGGTPPDGYGAFDNIRYADPPINSSGGLAFDCRVGSFYNGSYTVSTYGAYRYGGGSLETILRYDSPSPDGAGTVTHLEVKGYNDSGVALLDVRASTGKDMVVLATPGSATPIAIQGQTPPEGNGTWKYGPDPVNLNNAGQATFTATVEEPGGAQKSAAYLYSGSTNVYLARAGAPSPDGDGHWSSFGRVALNEAGQVFLAGYFSDAAAGTRRVYRVDGGSTYDELARTGEAPPDGDGTFGNFFEISPGTGGRVLFRAYVSDTSRNYGLFIADDREVVQVARVGDTVPGGGATFSYLYGAPNYTNGRAALNGSGQVAFMAQEIDQWSQTKLGIYLYTPELHYRGADQGDWGDSDNWTLRLFPSPQNPVLVDPAAGLTVQGPNTPTTIKRLTVNAQSGSTAVLVLNPSGPLTATEGTTIGSAGEVAGHGQLTGPVTGGGTIRAAGGTLTVGNGGSATEFSLAGGLTVDAGGILDLNYSDRLSLPTATTLNGGGLSAPGGLDLPTGATLGGQGSVQADVTNSGQIAATGGTLQFHGQLRGFGTSATGSVGLASTGSLSGEGAFGAALSGAAGSSILPTGDAAIGDAASAAGFDHQGSLVVAGHTVTLNDADQARIGGRTTVDGGTLTAPNGIRNAGELLLRSGGSTIAGGTFTNVGVARVSDGAGHAIAAALDNATGGRLETFEDLLLSGPTNTNDGQISVVGATMQFQQAATNNASGQINAINATLQFDGGLTNAGQLNLINSAVTGAVSTPAGGSTSVAGTVTFAGDVGGGSFTGTGKTIFQAGVGPGNSPGIMGFEGGVTLAATASLLAELTGRGVGDPLGPRCDALATEGDIDLGGTLHLSWLPVAGDSSSKFGGVYDVVTYKGARTGMFAGIRSTFAEAYVAGIEYDVDVNGDGSLFAVRMTLYDLLDGDADLNGQVDRHDFLAFEAASGATAGAVWAHGDSDLDGDVDADDYLALKGNLGALAGGGTIPEPATLTLLAAGAVALIRRRTDWTKPAKE